MNLAQNKLKGKKQKNLDKRKKKKLDKREKKTQLITNPRIINEYNLCEWNIYNRSWIPPLLGKVLKWDQETNSIFLNNVYLTAFDVN